jgi:hypothetical protein
MLLSFFMSNPRGNWRTAAQAESSRFQKRIYFLYVVSFLRVTLQLKLCADTREIEPGVGLNNTFIRCLAIAYAASRLIIMLSQRGTRRNSFICRSNSLEEPQRPMLLMSVQLH